MTNEVDKSKQIQQDEISLKDLILKIKEWCQYLWGKKWIIIAAGFIGGLLGFGYAFTKKPIYTATTTFVLESGEKSGGLGAYASIASMVGIDLNGGGGGIFQGDNILELYKSRTMIEKTLFSSIDSVSKQPLIEKYIEMNGLRKSWEKRTELKELHFSIADLNQKLIGGKAQRLRDSIIGNIADAIGKSYLSVAKLDKKLSIIKVDVAAKDEIFAKRFNEELVKNVNDFYVQTKTKKSLENVNILQHKTDSVRAVMNGAIYSAAVVVDATPNLNPTRQVQRAAPVQRAQFSAETNKAILSSLVQNLEMTKMTLIKETPLIQVVDEPVYPLKIEKKSKLVLGVLCAVLTAFGTCFILICKRKYRQLLNN